MSIATTTQLLGLPHCFDSMEKIGYNSSVHFHHALLNHVPTREHTVATYTEGGSMATQGFLPTRSGWAVELTFDPHLHAAHHVRMYIDLILHPSPLIAFDELKLFARLWIMEGLSCAS